MKVYLLRSQELSIETFGNVLNLLQQFPGPINFVAGETEEELNDLQLRKWESEEGFMEQTDMQFNCSDSVEAFPFQEQFQSWEFFFRVSDKYRERRNLPSSSHVFLLTDVGNELNWFGSISPSMNNYFIQTSHWNSFFGEEVDDRFPIAYKITIWIIRHFMFNEREDILESAHTKPKGCANDFCKNKKDIILKMRTADLCSGCMEILHARNVNPLIIGQLFDVMDGIRTNLTFRERWKIILKPSKMEVRGYISRIFLKDLGELEVRLNPKERAIYMFYLNHPEGVHLTELQDHREEIYSHYSKYTSQYEQDEINLSLDRLIDPIGNNINVVLSRIKRKFKALVGEELLDQYIIGGEHGGAKRIILDREYLTLFE